MNTAGHNSERDVLRSIHDGFYSQLIPTDESKYKNLKKHYKDLGRSYGVEYDYGEKYSSCDLAIMLGSWKQDRTNIHHILRTNIKENATRFLCIETPLLNRKILQPNQYYRIGFNGFLNRSAEWGEIKNYPDDRFKKLGLRYDGWRRNRGDKIVVALQLAGDASLRNNDINEWCFDVLKELREHTDRPIEVRTHPGISDKGWSNHESLFKKFAFSGIKNVAFVNGREVKWEDQIFDAHCLISYTSGLSIDAIYNGIPVIACDQGNFAWDISDRKISNIENLQLQKEEVIQQWLNNLAYYQWNKQEMESGEVYLHFKSTIERSFT